MPLNPERSSGLSRMSANQILDFEVFIHAELRFAVRCG
jgi:hypothetical protein